jgi:hypothetical protein
MFGRCTLSKEKLAEKLPEVVEGVLDSLSFGLLNILL